MTKKLYNESNKINYRVLRMMVNELCKIKQFNININMYDLFNMKLYHTTGENLRGKNIKYKNTFNKHLWNYKNKYKILEIPNKNNSYNSSDGNFIFITLGHGFYLITILNINGDNCEIIYKGNVSILPLRKFKNTYKVLITKLSDVFYDRHKLDKKFDFYKDRKRKYNN